MEVHDDTTETSSIGTRSIGERSVTTDFVMDDGETQEVNIKNHITEDAKKLLTPVPKIHKKKQIMFEPVNERTQKDMRR